MRPLTAAANLGPYQVRVHDDPDGVAAYFEIRLRGKPVHYGHGARFYIGQHWSDVLPIRLADLPSITGNGIPTLVVSEWSGGMKCCMSLHLFELGESFRKVETIEIDVSMDAWFENLDQDPALELEILDSAFADWGELFTGSFMPRVVLKYRDGQFRAAPDLMRRPAPLPAELDALAREVAESDAWSESNEPPDEYWSRVVDLLYTGNSAEAWRFFERAWPPARSGRNEFRLKLAFRLMRSPYWSDLRTWLSVPVDSR